MPKRLLTVASVARIKPPKTGHQRHSFSDEKRAALEAWGAHVMTLVENCPAS
jgi:hypothetical protein